MSNSMDVALYAALTGIWWMISLTVLLPFVILLKFSEYIRGKWFAVFFDKIFLPSFEPKVLPLRQKIFELLKENLKRRDVSTPLRVLEIGVGSGSNLQFYPENSHLTVLDINENFEIYFQKNQKKFPQVTYERTVISMAENMQHIDDSAMDVVISTFVLCSVNSVEDVLKEVKRVLKPGGKYIFLEHARSPDLCNLMVQRMAAPIWKVYFNGCCITRNIGDNIKNAGFSKVICENAARKNIMLFIRSQVYGIAIK